MADIKHTDQETLWGTGTSQPARLLKALRSGYVNIDERGMDDLLAYIAEYSRLIRHYDDKNNVSGNWESFFMKDISVLLSVMMATDLGSIENQHQNLIYQFNMKYQPDSKNYQVGQKFKLLLRFCEHSLSIPKMVDTWYTWLAGILYQTGELEQRVLNEIKKVIRLKMKSDLTKLRAYDLGAAEKGKNRGLGDPLGLDYDGFSKLWGLDIDPQPLSIFKGESLDDKLSNALVQIRIIYRSFYNTLAHLIFNIEHFFEESLENKSDHQPHVGLIIAFLKLFKHAQRDLNKFLLRHVDFYYRNILGEEERPAIPDEIHLCMELANHMESHFLPIGTQLFAGRDEEGTPIYYETIQNLSMNRAEVSSIKSLMINQNEDKYSNFKYAIITDIFSAPKANSKDGAGEDFEEDGTPWPLFGEEQENRRERTMKNGEVGFAIASPVLFLAEGERVIDLHLNFEKESAEEFLTLLQGMQEESGDIPMEVVFQTVFKDGGKSSLKVDLTGEEGWFTVDPANITILPPENWEADPLSIHINMTLATSDPAIVGFSARIHKGGKFVSRYPIARFCLEDTVPYGYTFLKNMRIKEVDIEVAVKKVRQLSLFNDIGKLDAAQPFQPFGPQPSIGSYLLVGNTEIFKKDLTDLTFHLEWQNMPLSQAGVADVDGFLDHYRRFEEKGLDVHPASYEVRLTALSNHEFFPTDEEGGGIPLPLFSPDYTTIYSHDTTAGDRIDRTIMEIPGAAGLNITPDPKLDSVELYDNNTASGFFKIELFKPHNGFGHQDFSRIFTEVATENAAKAAKANGEAEPPDSYPNSPYTPMLKSLNIDYKAKGKVDPLPAQAGENSGQFFHVYPFGTLNLNSFNKDGGIINPYTGETELNRYILPQFNEDGYLFLGIKGLKPPQELSLLFQLSARNRKSHSQQELPEIGWSYLSKNQWKDFEPIDYLLDTTETFTRTGMVRLRVPAAASNRNSLMPSGYHWIRVKAKARQSISDLRVLCYGLDIRAQAVKARWVDDGNSKRLEKPLPANSIQGLVGQNPEIKSVEQPYASFGGQVAETEGMFYRRVSERLSHKGRAISYKDYERLILDAFPGILQVKAMSHQSHPELIPNRGEIGLMVVPHGNAMSEQHSELTPQVNYQTLQDIEDFLKKNSSPFAQVKVRNPDYEYLRICCKIKFTAGNNNGHTLERLNQDIKKLVCPWLFDSRVPLGMGQSITEERILNGIKALDYVKFVTKFSIIHIFMEDESADLYKFLDTAESKDSILIQPQPWAVLVPDEMHEIEIVEDEEPEIAEPRPSNEPVRFRKHIDIIKSGVDERARRHATMKVRLTDTDRLTTRAMGKRGHSLNIKL